jgi:hypothetical protein
MLRLDTGLGLPPTAEVGKSVRPLPSAEGRSVRSLKPAVVGVNEYAEPGE